MGQRSLVVVVFSVLVLALVDAKNLTRFYLNGVDPTALCNDGSPAAYYFRAGYGAGSTRWVIRLQGGGWCFDAASCQSRKAQSVYWTTSTMCPPSLNDSTPIGPAGHEGILSSDPSQNPNFYNSNHVWMWYCSSDSHSGGSPPPTPEFDNWYFNGKANTKALITHLFKFQNFSSATQVLLNGDSAGGVATFSNVDYIEGLIRPVLPNVHYRAFVDAGWFLDIKTYNPNSASFREIAQGLYNNWKVEFNENCVSQFPGEEWKCFHAQYAHTFIKTPTFYQEYQYDSANLGFDGCSLPGSCSTYATQFSANMTAVISKIPYLFFPNCYKHESIDQKLWTGVSIKGISMNTAVWNWFQDTRTVPATSNHVDTCKPYNCNPGCSA